MNALKMDKRKAYRIQPVTDAKVILWIASEHVDAVKDTMPGVLNAKETDRPDLYVHTREYECWLDPLAETPEAAIAALTDFLNAAIGITPSPQPETAHPFYAK